MCSCCIIYLLISWLICANLRIIYLQFLYDLWYPYQLIYIKVQLSVSVLLLFGNHWVKVASRFCLTTLCKGKMKFSMFSTVLMKNVNLRLSPDVNAKHTTCRWVFAIKYYSVISSNHWVIKYEIYFTLNCLFPIPEKRCGWPSVDALMFLSSKISFALSLHCSFTMIFVFVL